MVERKIKLSYHSLNLFERMAVDVRLFIYSSKEAMYA